MAIDERIRYVAIISPLGVKEAGGMRPGVEPIDTDQEEEQEILRVAVRQGTMQVRPQGYGALRFSLNLYKNLLVLIYPLDHRYLLVTAEPYLPLERALRIEEAILKTR
jgi:DNA repair photolyase